MGAGRVGGLAVLFALAGGCAGQTAAPRAPERRIESLWELAPADVSAGVVVADGVPDKVLALIAALGAGPARQKLDETAKKREVDPLPSREGWQRAGLDPALGAAAFLWRDPTRGAFVVLPVRDRAAFRSAFHLSTRVVEGRTLDVYKDYVCGPAAERYACAQRASDLDAAAAAHRSPLAAAVAALPPEDRGDVTFYADEHVREIARLDEQAKIVGHVRGVAVQVRLRDDGISARAHVVADQLTPLARAFRGAPPSSAFQPAAVGAPTLVRVAIDPRDAIPPNTVMERALRTELVERFTGQLEMTTSGKGLAGLYAVAPVDEDRRVEAYVKAKCAEQGGSKLRYALRDIAVTEHGCSARFDPRMLLLPVHMDPLPLAAAVERGRLVVTVGDAAAPTAAERGEAFVARDSGAATALAGAEAIVAFTRSPWIGPDVDAGAAFKSVVSLLDEKTTTGIDAFDDVGARVAQAMMAARMADDGLVVTADVVTFSRDPAPARAAYASALALRSARDVRGYREALAAIERDHPGTLVAQRARDVREGGPWLGAGATFLSWLGARKSK